MEGFTYYVTPQLDEVSVINSAIIISIVKRALQNPERAKFAWTRDTQVKQNQDTMNDCIHGNDKRTVGESVISMAV